MPIINEDGNLKVKGKMLMHINISKYPLNISKTYYSQNVDKGTPPLGFGANRVPCLLI